MISRKKVCLYTAMTMVLAGNSIPVFAQAGALYPAFEAQRQQMIEAQKAEAAKVESAKAADSSSAGAGTPTGGGSSAGAGSTAPAGATPPAAGAGTGTGAAASTTPGATTSAPLFPPAAGSTGTDKDKDKTAATTGGDDKKTDEDEATDEEDPKKAEERKQKKEQDALEAKAKQSGYQPIQAAMFDINSNKPLDAISKLKAQLARNDRDVQAHYVLAIAYVMARKYSDAAAQYQAVLKLVPATSKVGQLATEGLRKIAR